VTDNEWCDEWPIALSCRRNWRTVVEDAAFCFKFGSSVTSRGGQGQRYLTASPFPVSRQLALIVKSLGEIDASYTTTRR